MARYRGSVCRLCRRSGIKLFLKGERCFTKCALDKRAYAAGQHGQRRIKISDYGIRLREKQKARWYYGLLEHQFRNYFEKAERLRGITGLNLFILIERRLDNVVFRLRLAGSRAQARQLVCHGHFLVNGKPVNIPSYQLRVGDTVEVREKSRNIPCIQQVVEQAAGRDLPSWLSLEAKDFRGKVASLPTREEIEAPVEEQLIVELYSKV